MNAGGDTGANPGMDSGVNATSGHQLLTAAGPAAIAVVRAWGPAAETFVVRHLAPPGVLDKRRTPGAIVHAALCAADGAVVDDILVTVHAAPPTWDVRLHLHGNPQLVRCCAAWLEAAGLPASAAGLRASAAGDGSLWPTAEGGASEPDALTAELWTALPAFVTLRGATWLLGQADALRAATHALRKCEDLAEVRRAAATWAARLPRVAWFTRPARVVLIGPPNVGKSTLANALADRPVSLVAPTPGTTRDWVEVLSEVDGVPVTWVDTAGLRIGGDELEAAAAERTRAQQAAADATVAVLDAGAPDDADQVRFIATWAESPPTCVALNKWDMVADAPDATTSPADHLKNWLARLQQTSRVPLLSQQCPPSDSVPLLFQQWISPTDSAVNEPATAAPRSVPVVPISARTGAGLDVLGDALLAALGRTPAALEGPGAFTARQAEVLARAAAAESLAAAREALERLLNP